MGSGRESACHAGDTRDAVSIPGSERSPGVGNGNSLQYSCLKNSMDRGAWQVTVHGVAKSWLQEWLSMHSFLLWVNAMEIVRLKARRISGAEAKISPFSLAFAQASFQDVPQSRNYPVYSVCRRPPSLLIKFLSCPVLSCFLFFALSNLSSHFDPSTIFSFRISKLALKGNFALAQRCSPWTL